MSLGRVANSCAIRASRSREKSEKKETVLQSEAWLVCLSVIDHFIEYALPQNTVLWTTHKVLFISFHLIRSRGNKAYILQTDLGKIPVYCHMTSIRGCGGGGWTLVMKIDGHKVSTFPDIIFFIPCASQ